MNNDYINFVTKITISLNKMYFLIIMKDIIEIQSINKIITKLYNIN